LGVLSFSNVTELKHDVENPVAAACVRRILIGVVEVSGVGQLYDRDETRRLGKSDVCGALTEVLLCRCLNAVGVAPEAGNVEVAEHDLFFGVVLLEADRELGLLELALE